MIYITGDTHGDFRNVERFCEKMHIMVPLSRPLLKK